MKKTTILFDLDGTLINSTEAILESFDVAYKSFDKQTPSSKTIKNLVGYPLDDMFLKMGVKKSEVEDYVFAYKEHYRLISRDKTFLLPGVKDALKNAFEFATLGVVTTKTSRYSKELLEHMNIIDYFDVLVGREDVANPKPNPEPILKALSLLKRDKKRCWMIGDTVMDVESANAAGVNACALTCGYGKKEVLEKICLNVTKDAKSAVCAIKLLLQKNKSSL